MCHDHNPSITRMWTMMVVVSRLMIQSAQERHDGHSNESLKGVVNSFKPCVYLAANQKQVSEDSMKWRRNVNVQR